MSAEANQIKINLPMRLEEEFKRGTFAINIETDEDWEMLPDDAFYDIHGKSLKMAASSKHIFTGERFPIHGVYGLNESGTFIVAETRYDYTGPIWSGSEIGNVFHNARYFRYTTLPKLEDIDTILNAQNP